MIHYSMHKREETLDNGMHVILVHKPEFVRSLFLLSAPVGGFDIRQSVDGQIKEHPTGCAHFLEHKMFNYKGGDVTDDFARLQANTNAFTSYTETAYYFQTTSDIKEPLKLLLDFVENLNITQESVDKEKGIILSEYNMYQQNPETHLMKNTWNALYENHPLHIDILGNVEDIENMKVEDLQEFYSLNYDPSRLTLVGVTGKDIDEVFEIIKEHQANVPSHISRNVQRAIKEEKEEVAQEYVTEEMETSTPYVCVAYKLNYFEDVNACLEHDLALSTTLDALFTTMNPEFQTWMDERIITQMVGAECDISPDHGFVMFYGMTEKVDEFIRIVEETVEKIKNNPIDEKILTSLRRRGIAQNIRSLDQYEGLAIDLIHAHLQGYDFIESLQIIESFTPEKVLSLVQHLDFSKKIISTIYPKTSNED